MIWNHNFKSLTILFPIIVVVFVLYYIGAMGPYLLDDFGILSSNTKLSLNDLSPSGLYEAIFSAKSGPLYRPVSMASFAFNYYLAGNTDPFSIKLTNILIHLFNTIGIFLLTLLLLSSSENPWLAHPHPTPPLEGEGNSLSLRERVRVRIGIFMRLCEPAAHDGSTENNFSNSP